MSRSTPWFGARLLARLAAVSVARPRTVVALAVALAATSLLLAAFRLELRTSNLDLIDPDLPAVRTFRELARDFGTPNALVVVLESADRRAAEAAVDRLVPLLAAAPGARSVLGALLPGPAAGAGRYFASRDGGLHFIFVQPDDPDSNASTLAPFVAGVRRILDGAGLAAEGIRVGLTGLPQYALDDRLGVERDLRTLSPLSLGLVLLLFVGAFASLRRPLLAMATLVLAVAVVLGLACLVPGHLTLLSAFFGSILFGLGVDYGIHVVDRVEELAAAGGAGQDGAVVAEAVRSLAPALATAGVTTASAFGALLLSAFRGFAELGLIAGVGVLVCLVAMTSVLPALLVLLPPRRSRRRRPRRRGLWLARLQSPALALPLALAALAAPFIARPAFDSDYLNLEPRGSEAVRLEREMVARSDFSPQFAAFITGSRQEAEALAARLRQEPLVGRVHSPAEVDAMAAWLGRAALGDLAARFESPTGRFAVYAYPRGDLWDRAVGDRFVDRMQALDPDVTGMPVLGRLMIDRSRRALVVSTLLSVAAILLWAVVDLRDLRLALLAASPSLLGVAAMGALMPVFGLAFNPVNVMALPVVVGVAVDDGLHIVHRLLAEAGDAARTVAGAGRAVTLTTATSIAAFGALSFASHQGLASFGRILVLGLSAALVLSVLVLPAVGHLVVRRRKGPGAPAGRREEAQPADPGRPSPAAVRREVVRA